MKKNDMEKKNYWYIDDDELSETIGAALQDSNRLDITFHKKKETWEQQLKDIISNVNNFDGLLLDWQLQGEADSENTGYDAEALAQQIRRLVSEGKIEKGFPIILCSAASEYERIFSKDLTGHDLFDLTYHKREFSESEERTNEIRNRFYALARDYPALEAEKDVLTLLGLEKDDELDRNAKGFLQSKLEDGIPHEIARILIDEVLSRDGLLITENLLAVRLGVDKDKSSEYWKRLLERLDVYKYKGLFYLGWDRWWMSKISNWWKESFSGESLKRTAPSEKVAHLNREFHLDLVPLKNVERKHTSELFWTMCSETGVPIDKKDGLILAGQDNLYPWQDKKYVSIAAATDPNADAPKVAGYELAKLSELKATFNNGK